MGIISIIPVIFFFSILLLIYFLVRTLVNKRTSFTSVQLGYRLSYYLLAGYGLILLICVIVYFSSINSGISTKEVDEVHIDDQYYEKIIQGKADELEGYMVKDEWRLTYSDETLHIKSYNTVFVNSFITVEESQELTNEIVASYYTPLAVYDGIDYTEKVDNITIELTEDNLILSKAEPFNLRLYKFSPEFTISQFTDSTYMDDYDPDYNGGISLIRIQVPEGVIVTNDETIDVQFIE
jgi:hypothetical protein